MLSNEWSMLIWRAKSKYQTVSSGAVLPHFPTVAVPYSLSYSGSNDAGLAMLGYSTLEARTP